MGTSLSSSHGRIAALLRDCALVESPRALSRMLLRLVAALAVLATVEALVRARAPLLDHEYVDAYRIPDVLTPPIREFASAVRRARSRDPDRIFIGMAGPSTVWGYGLSPTRTLPASVESDLERAGSRIGVLNLAMPRSRYSDDRIVAAYFSGEIDALLVPFSAFMAQAIASDACPSHLAIVEWSDRIPLPFAMPSQCAQPQTHRVDAWLDTHIASFWSTYEYRPALRHLLFPDTNDFGRAVERRIFHARAPEASGDARDSTSSAAFVPRTERGEPDRKMVDEVARLCEAYAANGANVYFYHLPSRPYEPGVARESEALLASLEASIRFVAGQHARCELIELSSSEPLDPARDYVDYVHPSPRGIDKLAQGLASTLVDLEKRGTLTRSGR